MSKEIDELKTNIRERLLNLKTNNFSYSNNTIKLSLSLSDADYKSLIQFANKNSISQEKLNALIKEERELLQNKLQPKTTTKYKINPSEISLGQHIKIYTNDQHGEAIEELINIDYNKFILIGHERGSLLVGDVLTNTTSPWNEGGVIDFEVFRDNKKFVYDKDHTIYRTRKVKHFQLIDPQFDYDKLFPKAVKTNKKKDEE